MSEEIDKTMSDEEYVHVGGMRCPYCRSENITGGDIEVDGPTAWTEDECDDCGETWKTVYGVCGWAPL